MKPSPKKEKQKDFCYTHYLTPAADIHPVFVRFDYNSGRENFDYGKHRHADHELVYVLKGRYEAKLNGQPLKLVADQMLLCCPGDEHHDHALAGLEYYTLSFLVQSGFGKGREISIVQHGCSVANKIFNAPNKTIQNIMHEAAQVMQRATPGSAHLAQTLLQEVFWRLILLIPDELYTTDFFRLSEPDNFARRFYNFLEEKPEESIEVADVAQALSISQSQLAKLCSRHLGESPGRLIQKFRIQRVCEMLAKSNLPIGEISVMLGFKDQFTLSRTFKRLLGIPPQQWRQQAQNDADMEVSQHTLA